MSRVFDIPTLHSTLKMLFPLLFFIHFFHDFDISRKNIRLANIHVDFCINVQMCKYKWDTQTLINARYYS